MIEYVPNFIQLSAYRCLPSSPSLSNIECATDCKTAGNFDIKGRNAKNFPDPDLAPQLCGSHTECAPSNIPSHF